jgi:hypothetical protein
VKKTVCIFCSILAEFTLINDGKWDAAFAVMANPDLGFDFKDSPFGADPFDLLPFQTGYKYGDVFTGMVFNKAVDGHKMVTGIPGLINEPFADELKGRFEITGECKSPDEVTVEIEKNENNKYFGLSRQ